MNDIDKQSFGALLKGLQENYEKLGIFYNSAGWTNLAYLWWNALKKYDFEVVNEAITYYVTYSEYHWKMPMIGAIIRIIEGDPRIRAIQAWAKVVEGRYKTSNHHSVKFDDPIIHKVVEDMGGWKYLCKSSNQDEPFKKREFEFLYCSYVGRKLSNIPEVLKGKDEELIVVGNNNKLLEEI